MLPALQIKADQRLITLTAYIYHVMIIVAFPRKLFLLLFSEAGVRIYSSKQVL